MIHKFSIDEINIVMDINSGSIHIVDNIVYEIIDFFKDMSENELITKFSTKFDSNEIISAINEIKNLEKDEMIFYEDDYEIILPKLVNRNPLVKALCLHIAHDCNLKCKYCFAEEGEYNGARSLMSFDVGKNAIDFLIKNSGARKNLEIDFFGGEPLMNFEVIKKIVEYGREQEKIYNKNFRFTITTNGILLDDEKIDYINKNMYNVVLSLDGRKEINDNMRPKVGGQGSYDIIVPKFKKLVEKRKGKNYYVRGTFTKNNIDFSNDVLHLADLGFEHISIEPVVAEDEMSYSITKKDISKVYDEYEKLARIIYERKINNNGFNFFHFNIDLDGGPCVFKRLSGCGSGSEYLAVTPEGDLYPCHQFVGKDEFKMGTVYEGIQDKNRFKEFSNCNVYSKPECRNCWAKFYCSGGCAANAYEYGGNILSNYNIGCELQKKRIECAIFIKAKEALSK